MIETNPLLLEIRSIQNPALGAALLWRFAVGFRNAHKFSQSAEFQLLFLVLPILWSEELFAEVKSTQASSGLHRFVGKFSESANLKQDILIGIHGRAALMRELTLSSYRVAQVARLLALTVSGQVVALSESPTRSPDAEIRALFNGAEKLGRWCGELTMTEIALALKVRF